MKEQLRQRLENLKSEYQSGEEMLIELKTKYVNLRETLLRISGAIQVLEEELEKAPDTETNNHPLLATVDTHETLSDYT